MNIKFFLSNNDLAPTTISGKLYANALIKRGYDIEVVQKSNRKLDILNKLSCNMILFQKTFDKGHSYNEVRHLKGKVHLVYIDDDFLGMNDKNHINTLNVADLILVGNKQHEALMHKYTKTPVETITSINDFENYRYIPFETRNNNPLIISWQQSLADVYISDLLSIKYPLINLHKEYGIRLQLYGWHEGKHYGKPDNRRFVSKYFPFAEFISFMPYDSYIKHIVPKIAMTDIFIVPYLDIPDRYGKAGFGLKRIMMLGVPVIVSDIGIHKEIIQDGVNGYIATTADEWYQKLKELITQSELRKKFSLTSRNLIDTKYSYDNCVNIFIDAIKKYIPDFK
ncbi:glycosyltransferase [Vallitalea guaymasensis]|uniref:glycosyltransferase n=1 Tax=Vallitalea guaymasensis TaxID=1185412 RepID=UPI00272AA677|nr:glycosyltransferase [Vallitalea guaymasensis]